MDKPCIIHMNLGAKCRRCGKGDATQNGVCLPCITKALKAGEFDNIINKIKPSILRQHKKKTQAP